MSILAIALYKPTGEPKIYHNIVKFWHQTSYLLEFTYHNVGGVHETVRTSLPYAIFAESPEDIEECDETRSKDESN